MRADRRWRWAVVGIAFAVASAAAGPSAQVTADAPARRPDSIVDLMTDAGVKLVT